MDDPAPTFVSEASDSDGVVTFYMDLKDCNAYPGLAEAMRDVIAAAVASVVDEGTLRPPPGWEPGSRQLGTPTVGITGTSALPGSNSPSHRIANYRRGNASPQWARVPERRDRPLDDATSGRPTPAARLTCAFLSSARRACQRCTVGTFALGLNGPLQ